MRKSPIEMKLAEISVSLDNDWDWAKTNELIENGIFRQGTYAMFGSLEHILGFYKERIEQHNTLWYKSTETIMSESPTYHWLSKKKWPLSEQLNLHIMNYQEVSS